MYYYSFSPEIEHSDATSVDRGFYTGAFTNWANLDVIETRGKKAYLKVWPNQWPLSQKPRLVEQIWGQIWPPLLNPTPIILNLTDLL